MQSANITASQKGYTNLFNANQQNDNKLLYAKFSTLCKSICNRLSVPIQINSMQQKDQPIFLQLGIYANTENYSSEHSVLGQLITFRKHHASRKLCKQRGKMPKID